MFPGLVFKKSFAISYAKVSFDGMEAFENKKEGNNIRFAGEWARQLLCVSPTAIQLVVDMYQFNEDMSINVLEATTTYLQERVFLEGEDLAHLLRIQKSDTDGVFDPRGSWNHVLVKGQDDQAVMGVSAIQGTVGWTLSMRRKKDTMDVGRTVAKKGERLIVCR